MPGLTANTVASGIRTVGSVETDAKVTNFLKKIGKEIPHGTFPMLGILKGSRSITTPSQNVKWYDKPFPWQIATVAGVYTSKDCKIGNVYVDAASAVGTLLYLKITDLDNFNQFRVDREVMLFEGGNSRNEVVGLVTDKSREGAYGILGITLKQVAPYVNGAAPTGYGLSDADTIRVISNRRPEFGAAPAGIIYNKTQYEQVTGISVTPIRVSRSARAQEFRTGDAYKEAASDAIDLHGQELEMSSMFSVFDNTSTGDNGEAQWSPDGFLTVTKEHGLTDDYKYSTSYGVTGKSWADGGLDWLEGHLTEVGRFQHDYVCVCGYKVMKALQQLVRANSQYGIVGTETKFGTKVTKFVLPGMTLSFFTHPLWQGDDTRASQMWIIDPSSMAMATLKDGDTTHIKTAKELEDRVGATAAWVDGTIEVILTEYTFLYRFPNHWALLSGIGETNLMS